MTGLFCGSNSQWGFLSSKCREGSRVLEGKTVSSLCALTDPEKWPWLSGFGWAVADRESANSPEMEPKASARVYHDVGSKELSLASSLLLFQDGKNIVCGVSRNIILLSSHGGQPRAMPEACIILEASGPY